MTRRSPHPGGSTLTAVSLDPELCAPPSLWLLVEIRRCATELQTAVLRVDRVLVVGRDPHSGLVLEGALVSRRHALVRRAGAGLEVEDISRHGTLVDGLCVHKARVQVASVTELMVGCNQVRLRRLG